MSSPIHTSHDYPPIPDRGADWSARWANHDGDTALVGRGLTELLAVVDLLRTSLDEDEADDVVDMAARYWQSIIEAKDTA